MTDRPLWTCPRCGKRFVNRNTFHSCGRHTIEQYLEGKGPRARQLWESLVTLVERCGPFDFVANKSRIGFMVRVRFAGITNLSERGMTLGFWLKERIESPRFSKVEQYTPRDWGYHLRITSPQDLDDEVAGWLCRAYQVGCQQAD